MGVYKLSANSVKNGRTIYGSMLAGNTTYEPPKTFNFISSQSLTSDSASVTFSSISSQYTHLVLRWSAWTTSASPTSIRFRFNNDTGSNYSTHGFYELSGNNYTSTSGVTYLGNGTVRIPETSNRSSGTGEAEILEYSKASRKRVLRGFGGYNDPNGFMMGMWNNTDTITSIEISLGAGNIKSGSYFSLYGIRDI